MNISVPALLALIGAGIVVVVILYTAIWVTERKRGRRWPRCYVCDSHEKLTNVTRTVRICYPCLTGAGEYSI